jgi:glutamate-ammonia-ligase adenylyltransferase
VDYYRQRAQLWELQALSRCRPVAGHPDLGRRFTEAVASLTDFSRSDCPAAARTPAWKAEVARMRHRIEKERTSAGKDHLAIKTGRGGLVDAEFVAQAFNLERGWHEANTLQALERARSEGLLPTDAAECLIVNYRRLRRLEGILRRWSYEGETELPDDPAPQYRVAVRCGFATIEDFFAAVNRYRQNIREVYEKVLPAAAP